MTFAEIATTSDLAFLASERGRGRIGHWIDGRAREFPDSAWRPVTCPYDGATLAEVPLGGAREVAAAAAAGAEAFRSWRRVNVRERAQVMFRFKRALEERADELARTIAAENGKTLGEARAELLKGVEVVEFACALPQLATGELAEVARGIDCCVVHEPLGVVASITPFNFPAMVPLWTIPIALTLGNAVIHKPSEQVPLTALGIAGLLAEAGLPPGVFQVVHGQREAVEALCDQPEIRAVSFVGSTAVARAVYRRATAADKRVLALGGAKNHLIVLPDAEPDATAKAVLDAATGCAGQRCMAASVLVAVAGCEPVLDLLAERARAMALPRDMGAVISPEARTRIESAIRQAESEGAAVAVDGRAPVVPPPLAGGHWLGPTLLEGVSAEMTAAREEIFGPVLAIVRVASLDRALELENASGYGNAASVFTSSGEAAREVASRANAGMIGVNVGIPVPREPFGFGGWNQSKFGAGDVTGRSSIGFWTRDKKITARWGSA